jgi:beta-glucanase (GH16 family)
MLWDAKDVEASDPLHDPDPIMDAMLDSKFDLFSARGWFNVSALIILMTGLITLFAGFPVIHYFTSLKPPNIGYNLGGINGTGQIPDLNLPNLIDKDTPDSAKSRKGSDGNNYVLVFSDEFETAGRTFWTGDDPYWEAVDLHYWPTGDLEWYTPDAITTANGHLVITMTETPNHGNLNWESGMLQSWNKLCFSSGYIEVSVSLPGSSKVPGFWPGVWTMGNLGRAGYGATTEGMWPYSYDECDVGTFPNQTNPASLGGGPAAATLPDGSALSFQPGQKTSACTCKGADHPGPDVSVGRGVPELDV